jgi:hypothetical protein
MTKPQILGAFEPVSFPKYKMENIMAKMDTGAYTGALHCTTIKEIVKPSGIKLELSPFDNPELIIRTSDFVVRQVRSSNGSAERRYFINTTIKVRGKTYPILLSLANRSEMKWSVLIGRRFLRENNFVVDVRTSKTYVDDVK